MTVYFHGNVGLDRPRMAGILRRGLEKPKITDPELAKPFGYVPPLPPDTEVGFTKLESSN